MAAFDSGMINLSLQLFLVLLAFVDLGINILYIPLSQSLNRLRLICC